MGFWGCSQPKPLSRQALIIQAEADLKAGRFHEALAGLNQALKDDPKNVNVHLNLGWIYVYTDQLEKASTEIRSIEKLDPGHPGLYYLKGALFEKLGQPVDALDAYNEALQTEINNPDLHRDIADVFLELNQPDAALREYDMALRLDSTNSDYQFGRCKAFRLLKQYDPAVDACGEAMALTDDPKSRSQIQEVRENIKLIRLLESPPTEDPKKDPT